ncbi:MAG: aminoacyl-tRNA hydrolase [Pseudomonadota bacterium]
MILIVGLGNPGQKYARNRHNIGFMAVDEIAHAHGFGPWREKFQGAISDGRIGAGKVLLLKPNTFMNLSGQSVGEAMRFYKLEPDKVIVLHDELDLAPGKVRVKTGGGHAGHNGLRSLHQHIGDTYVRVRLGIGHPGDKRLVSHYVLGDFAKADEDWLSPLIDGIGRAFPELVAGDAAKFQSQVALYRQTSAPDVATKTPKPAPKEPKAEPPRSALQRLVDKFSSPGP